MVINLIYCPLPILLLLFGKYLSSLLILLKLYILLCFCWIFFIANDIKEGFSITSKIFSSFDLDFYIDSINVKDFYIISIGILVLFVLDVLKEKKMNIEKFCVNKISSISYLFILLILVLLIIYFGLHIPNNFIYSSF